MERLYNPDLMTEEEIKTTFVARQNLLDKLVNTIKNQPEGAGVQHVVLIAARGMGKTTLLLMLQYAIQEQGLNPPWLPIRFPEELYNVNDLADFWLEVLDSVARETNDQELSLETQRLKDLYPDSERLQEALTASIKKWCRKNERRLVLLVDNLNLILNVTNEQEEASLRRVLMNEGFLMIVGAAPAFFREATDYALPLYQFFKVEQLRELTQEEMRDLLRRRAAADGVVDFETTLRENDTRLKVLEYFTGGNPRLALMLYRVISQSEVLEVREGLEKLLDQVTPYYKDKMESLPPQQRKILDYIARVSGETHEGVTPTDIGRATRIATTTVTAQLKRLAEAGYVRAANIRGRKSYYVLSERLFALWYQMRFGRNARQKMGWLVDFLKAYYSSKELSRLSAQLEGKFQELFASGHTDKAKNILEHLRWIVEAMGQSAGYEILLDVVINGYLKLNEIKLVHAELLNDVDVTLLSPNTLQALVNTGWVPKKGIDQINIINNSQLSNPLVWFFMLLLMLFLLNSAGSEFTLDQILDIQVDGDDQETAFKLYMLKFGAALYKRDLDRAKVEWFYAQNTKHEDDFALSIRNQALISAATMGYVGWARTLIKESSPSEFFFPLERALIFLETHDQTMIEKLSPEILPLVEDLILQIQTQMDTGLQSLPNKRP